MSEKYICHKCGQFTQGAYPLCEKCKTFFVGDEFEEQRKLKCPHCKFSSKDFNATFFSAGTITGYCPACHKPLYKPSNNLPKQQKLPPHINCFLVKALITVALEIPETTGYRVCQLTYGDIIPIADSSSYKEFTKIILPWKQEAYVLTNTGVEIQIALEDIPNNLGYAYHAIHPEFLGQTNVGIGLIKYPDIYSKQSNGTLIPIQSLIEHVPIICEYETSFHILTKNRIIGIVRKFEVLRTISKNSKVEFIEHTSEGLATLQNIIGFGAAVIMNQAQASYEKNLISQGIKDAFKK